MTTRDPSSRIRIAFEVGLPQARWGPLFHVFRLEQPDVRVEWEPRDYPTRDSSLLCGADLGVFFEPPREAGLTGLTLEVSPMVVIVAAGDRLGDHAEVCVADILDRAFPAGPSLDPDWMSFWTLDAQRGGPPAWSDEEVTSVAESLEVVAAGDAILTAPASIAVGLAHPGVIALPLGDAPPVHTRLLWRPDQESPGVWSLIELAAAWTRASPNS
jgi:DNA-binding transcriptional LysR family regulator